MIGLCTKGSSKFFFCSFICVKFAVDKNQLVNSFLDKKYFLPLKTEQLQQLLNMHTLDVIGAQASLPSLFLIIGADPKRKQHVMHMLVHIKLLVFQNNDLTAKNVYKMCSLNLPSISLIEASFSCVRFLYNWKLCFVCFLQGNKFHIELYSGTVTVIRSLDYESVNNYTLKIIAKVSAQFL